MIEITSSTYWVQFAMGRFVAGLGIGSLSSVVPMYQSESIPKAIRGATVASYQLFITLGIWTAYMVNYGTEGTYHNSAQWRIPNGLSALWAILLGTSILFMPESPRFAYRQGREDEARSNMARLSGVEPYSDLINQEIYDIQSQLDAEHADSPAGQKQPWYSFVAGPRMIHRTILGMVLQAGQQLTGANFFFYFGTTIFAATGLSNSYVTSIILGTVNVVATIGGLWLVENCGRRKALMGGAAWMFMCLMIYSLVGQYCLDRDDPTKTPTAGNVLIVFTCLFIAAFATTWGPLVCSLPPRLRKSIPAVKIDHLLIPLPKGLDHNCRTLSPCLSQHLYRPLHLLQLGRQLPNLLLLDLHRLPHRIPLRSGIRRMLCWTGPGGLDLCN